MMYQPPYMRGPGLPTAPVRPGVPSARDFMPIQQPGMGAETPVIPSPSPRVPAPRDFMPSQPRTGSAPVQMLAQKMARRPVKRGMTSFGA